MEFFKKVSSFPFMHTRRVWYVVSAVLVVASLASLFTRGLNLSTEFLGGVTIHARLPAGANTEAVASALQRAGFADPTVTLFGSSSDVSIRLPAEEKLKLEVVTSGVTTALKSVDAGASIVQTEQIGAQVGKELRNSAWWSLGTTLALIFLYVAVRFHTWRLSLGAIVAALHDPILVVGFFSFTRMVFDLPTVAAILAVIGYSLNDTVVVFDRIRERFHAARKLPPAEVLDQSINQTLSRTIITSGATLVVVVVLLAIGGPVLKGFAAALTVGILVGTYSSIYIASAIALDTGLKGEHLLPTAVKQPVDSLP